jgi:hypothetical protein
MARLLTDGRALAWIVGAVLIYILALAAPPAAGLSHAGQAVLGIALAGVALWASEAVPLGFAAIFVLVLLGTAPGGLRTATFGGFAAPVVFFLMGAVALEAAHPSAGEKSGDRDFAGLSPQIVASLDFANPLELMELRVQVRGVRDYREIEQAAAQRPRALVPVPTKNLIRMAEAGNHGMIRSNDRDLDTAPVPRRAVLVLEHSAT